MFDSNFFVYYSATTFKNVSTKFFILILEPVLASTCSKLIHAIQNWYIKKLSTDLPRIVIRSKFHVCPLFT